jgi:hypothetical protein
MVQVLDALWFASDPGGVGALSLRPPVGRSAPPLGSGCGDFACAVLVQEPVSPRHRHRRVGGRVEVRETYGTRAPLARPHTIGPQGLERAARTATTPLVRTPAGDNSRYDNPRLLGLRHPDRIRWPDSGAGSNH